MIRAYRMAAALSAVFIVATGCTGTGVSSIPAAQIPAALTPAGSIAAGSMSAGSIPRARTSPPLPAAGPIGAAPNKSASPSKVTSRSTTTPHSPDRPSAAAAIDRRAVPPGQRAVDESGLEIFVPAELALDPPCPGNSVNRPAKGLTYEISCVPLVPPAIWMESAEDAAGAPPSSADCLSRPVLDGEVGCVVQDPQQDATSVIQRISWPRHGVGMTFQVLADKSAWVNRIIATARWVPVDRHGCTMSRSPVGLPGPAVSKETRDARVLPENTARLSICWYSRRHLAASAEITTVKAIRSIAVPTQIANGPGIDTPPFYLPQATAPVCADLDKTEGIVFIAHRPNGSSTISSAQLADCRGEHSWTTGATSTAVGEPLASALRQQAGFLITYGYRPP